MPYPRKITLIKQLAKCHCGLEPRQCPWLGDCEQQRAGGRGDARLSLALGSRTKALVEKLNMAACTYRISVQCPASGAAQTAAVHCWWAGRGGGSLPPAAWTTSPRSLPSCPGCPPSNNYSHVIFTPRRAGVEKGHRQGRQVQVPVLQPQAQHVAYKVRSWPKPHQMPWQLPLGRGRMKGGLRGVLHAACR